MYQAEQISILIITCVLSAAFIFVGSKIRKLSPKDVPKGPLLAVVLGVEMLINFTVENMGKKHGRTMAAYIGSVFIYIFVANISGLFGLQAPTSNFSVTLVLALITWLMIQITKIRENGFKGYLKGFLDPFPLFLIPNIFSTVAPLISMSLRLFGNVISGSVIMGLIYTFTAWLSSFIPFNVAGFNFVSLVVTPWLHLYFDLFSGFLQAFIFISLTSIFIAIEYSDEEENYG